MSKGNIIKKCEKFLKDHEEKFQDPNFKHIKYIVDILPYMKEGTVSRRKTKIEIKNLFYDNYFWHSTMILLVFMSIGKLFLRKRHSLHLFRRSFYELLARIVGMLFGSRIKVY